MIEKNETISQTGYDDQIAVLSVTFTDLPSTEEPREQNSQENLNDRLMQTFFVFSFSHKPTRKPNLDSFLMKPKQMIIFPAHTKLPVLG